MNEKSSLKIYRKWRRGQEKAYVNNQTSEILFKARKNNLILNERNRFWGEDIKCYCVGLIRRT